MKKLIPLLILFTFCSKKEIVIPTKNYTFSIDSVLMQSGNKSLPIDANGFYHLKLIPNSNQQPYRITGRILVNGKEPYPNENVNFESNLYWWLRRGDEIVTITKTYINYFTGQFTIVNLPALISNKDELVPTTNSSSYSGKGGEINTIISPIREMIGDTLVLKTSHSISNKNIYTKIVLD